eukprot:TRINITY_DN16762_c0_g1_i1.p1 TRINITY_DN16762_c0_g1~~TRINITY_DN16762_c0_g1_i1.p1  ORF type:complete len:66 (+),score=2.85 TRINITY_DN16762_c0_g1_i1:33-230(+)
MLLIFHTHCLAKYLFRCGEYRFLELKTSTFPHHQHPCTLNIPNTYATPPPTPTPKSNFLRFFFVP